ncbi:tail length tape measure protein [Pseudaestuariivita atlantica]|uniref:Tail length tape measure protein n=1 Tax=Pseudaestuariivita atlantica TaxID=1317121 RepID=A0A0L1JTJ0_9RHOB|nr:tail length tape measure protein [Pseudaestuariivita atlantica]
MSEDELFTPRRPLALAMDFVRAGAWGAARAAAAGDGPIAQDIVEWHRLREGLGTPTEVLLFLRRNPDWPGLPYLRRKSEPSFLTASELEVRTFFAGMPPQSAAGALALARVQDAEEARLSAIAGWRSYPMTGALQADYLEAYGEALAPHHAARLDAMLWQGAKISARRMLPLVGDEVRAVAEARLAYADRAGDVAEKFEAVPEVLRSSPGLRHARFEWMLAKGRRDEALALMREASENAAALGEPSAWAGRRRQLVREEMRSGRFAEAYALAAPHHLVDGTAYSDLEWLAGYLSLRLGEPARALGHFERLDANVTSPISKGRAGYWRGRALEAMGDTAGAMAAYTEGGAYQTSFYGLLAAEKAGLPHDPRLAGDETFPSWRDAEFRQLSVFKAAVLLLAADDLDLSERFFTHLSERLDRTGVGQLGDLLMALERPHIQVMLGKRAAQAGLEVPGPYYALHPVAEHVHPVPTELVLAISRRESEFDPVVVSGAGARGLMQLMPGTARDVSRDLGLPYGRDRLLSDPRYNATLGAAYLRGLAERFDGNVVMMAAGYNAGPGRPVRWMERFGDPRKGAIDVVDWIEMIPFNETRNYVMRVAESLPVYRARLGKDPHPVPFSKELVGSTLLPLEQ